MSIIKKGFTLIELLIVIAVLGVLSAVVLVGIDPVDKINAANDSNVQNTISAIANATESYGAQNNGSYPAVADVAALQSALVSSGDLKVALTVPTGYTLTTNGATTATSVKLCVTLKSKKYTQGATYCNAAANCYWTWTTAAGKASVATACP